MPVTQRFCLCPVDFREQTIKDVITQIEPELFYKVTGLTVKDFETLCSIGLFDPEKMNQGIFGFRKYENSSLSYTGIDKHAGEAVGGWDTVLRREEYNALYSKHQATLTDFEKALLPGAYLDDSVIERQATAKADDKDENEQGKDIWETILANVKAGDGVTHKKFGDGTINWIGVDKKYLKVKFAVGEKQFIFPDAFVMGFLTLK